MTNQHNQTKRRLAARKRHAVEHWCVYCRRKTAQPCQRLAAAVRDCAHGPSGAYLEICEELLLMVEEGLIREDGPGAYRKISPKAGVVP